MQNTNQRARFVYRVQSWWKKPPLILIYLLFLILSVGSVYGVLIHNNQFFYGDDLGFHLARIEGLSQSIQQGTWFPRINYFITGGMGYATGIFYPDLLLYPAALLRVAGLTLAQSYLWFVLLVNWFTFMIAYHSFHVIVKNRHKSLLFAFLYGLASYRMSDLVYRAAVGEYLALMILPIAFVGLYQVIKGNERHWLILAIGMSLLFYAHLLSAGMMILFSSGFLFLNIRGVWREKRRFLAIVKAVGVTLLLVANSLLPMIEQLLFQRLRVQDEPVFYLQRQAETIGEYVRTAIQNIGFNNIGLPILCLLVLWLCLFRRLEQTDSQLLILAGTFFFLATSYFPHWLFHGTSLNAIQFPWRYFIFVTFCVCWIMADNYDRLFSNQLGQRVVVAVLVVSVLIVNLTGQIRLTEFEARRGGQVTLNEVDGETQIGYGKEYLPSNMSSWASPTGLLSEPSDVVQTANMSRSKNVFSLDVVTEEPAKLIFPLIYYKGYQVRFEGEGTVSEVEDAEKFKEADMHGFVQVKVSGSGRLTLWYEGTLIQKGSFYLSWITLFVILAVSLSRKWKNSQMEKL